MPSQLKTDYLTIGRSGKTIDGRTISADMLREVANTYDPKNFSALIWPEHERWFNMGKVEAIRAVDNAENGVDLQAVLAPNDYYLSANSYGQKLFSSMELTTNFRGTGKAYLTGLGATDSPASAGTTMIRFTASEEGEFVRSTAVELPRIDEQENKRFVSADLESRLAAVEISITKLTDRVAALEEEDANEAEAMSARLTDMDAKFTQFIANDSQKFCELEEKLAKLETFAQSTDTKLTEALNTEHPVNTPPPRNPGAADRKTDFI